MNSTGAPFLSSIENSTNAMSQACSMISQALSPTETDCPAETPTEAALSILIETIVDAMDAAEQFGATSDVYLIDRLALETHNAMLSKLQILCPLLRNLRNQRKESNHV